ncbi:MAG: rhomboid family intramembrane serine protease [Acidobacteria bacterium]|nr:rhomboid family intramembrane serine protease [Acidobacteriota bacterium]
MFLPLGDEPNPRGVPWVTYGLIAANVAVYLLVSLPLSFARADPADPALAAYIGVLLEQFGGRLSAAELVGQVSAYDLVVFTHGFRPADPAVTALFTSMFLHAGFMHLAGNMLFLWIYGDNVEHRLGPYRYLLAYLATGVAATLFHTTFDAGSELPLVGASGAISGVLGFYFIWFPHNRVRLWIVLFPFFMQVVRWPARVVLAVYLFIDNVLPFLVAQGMEGGGVAYGAHIGGFLGGLGWAWWSGRREVAGRPAEYRADAYAPATSAGDAVAAQVAARRFGEAAPAYFRLTPEQTRRLLPPEDSIALADWLASNGHPAAALVVYQRQLRDYPVGELAAEAHLGAGLVQLHALDQPTAAYQHLVEVFDLDPEPDTAAYARQALAEIAALQKFKGS